MREWIKVIDMKRLGHLSCLNVTSHRLAPARLFENQLRSGVYRTRSRVYAHTRCLSISPRLQRNSVQPPQETRTALPAASLQNKAEEPAPEPKDGNSSKKLPAPGQVLTETSTSSKEQRRADWAILKEMSRYLWPKVRISYIHSRFDF